MTRLPVPDDVQARDGLCACGCGQRTPIAKRTQAHRGNYAGFPTRWAYGHGRSKGHPSVGVGGVVTRTGYIKFREPSHPNADSTGYVMLHRKVMAEAIGRALEPWETVHHINGDRADNRLENLQLRVGNHGKGAVLTCRDCGGHNIAGEPLGE